MVDSEAKPLQAVFDIGNEEVDVEEGTGFEPRVEYTFSLDREARGTYMTYGKTPKPVTVGERKFTPAGLYVLGKKIPVELHAEYFSHPDQFEIFTPGVVNGQQVLIPGRDFEKFKPFLTQRVHAGWKCKENGRLVFMDLALPFKVNPGHPEFENDVTHLARKLGYEPPVAKINGKPNPEKANLGFLHAGIEIIAEIVTIKSNNPQYKDTIAIDIDTIKIVGAEGRTSPQAKISIDDIDAELQMQIEEAAEGCTKESEVFKKMKDDAAAEKKTYTSTEKTAILDAIRRMKDAGKILKA